MTQNGEHAAFASQLSTVTPLWVNTWFRQVSMTNSLRRNDLKGLSN